MSIPVLCLIFPEMSNLNRMKITTRGWGSMNRRVTRSIAILTICGFILTNITGCTLTPSQETINLQLIEPAESDLPVIDEVYRRSVGDEVYSKPSNEETFLP